MTTPGIDAEPLTAWLAERVPGLRAPLTFDLIAGGRSNLTFGVTDAGGRRLVLRRPPTSHVLASAHDMGREARVMSALAPTDVPVPPVLAVCDDPAVTGAPFFVMDHVEGHVLRGAKQTGEVLDEGARGRVIGRLVEVLAAIHAVDLAAVGLADYGPEGSYIERQLRRWHRQVNQSFEQAEAGGFGHDAGIVNEVHDALAERIPPQTEVRLVHGDFRLDNTIVGADGDIRAVLDWELSTIGEPLADVATMMVYWADAPSTSAMAPATALPGFPSRDELGPLYAAASGRSIDSLPYFVAFAHWRIACIMEGVYVRYRAGAMGEAEGVGGGMGDMVVRRAEQARKVLADL